MSDIVRMGDATLYHGDCLEILPTLDKVDAVVTDPPYGIGDIWKGGAGGKSSWKIPATETHSWDMQTNDIVETFPEIASEVIIWGGNYYNLPPTRCWLLWDKKQNDNWTTAQAEMAWTNLDRTVRTYRMAQCEAATQFKGKVHPTEKPLRLMEWCFKWVVGESILDPFMGSGTTGVACANLGRKFIGIEIERKYFDIACERIEAAYAQGRLFA